MKKTRKIFILFLTIQMLLVCALIPNAGASNSKEQIKFYDICIRGLRN